MKVKEEAERIIEMFESYVDYNEDDCLTSRQVILINARQCALIYVDGIIKALDEYDDRTEAHLKSEFGIDYFSCELQNMDSEWRYWHSVKEQIKLL